MICRDCLDAAMGEDFRMASCPVCGMTPVAVYRMDVPEKDQRVYLHCSSPGVQCPGGMQHPKFVGGHDRCNNACPCQHRPSGSWNGHPKAKDPQ